MNKGAIDYSLYLVTDRELLGNKDLVQTIDQAIQGGVTIVQVREKDLATLHFFQVATAIKEITKRFNIPFIINDRADIALAVDADGLHIGQEDMPLVVARKIVGPNKIIGVSITTLEEALLAEKDGADYLGIGAIFPTRTKNDAKYVSLSELKEIQSKISIPIVAIGGINEDNIKSVMETGVDGAAIVSAIIASPNPGAAARNFCQLMNR